VANVTITQLPAAGPITGTESVPIVQNGQTVQTTTGAIAASPSQNQTFLTLNNEPTLANSRYLSTGTGLGLTDGGAQSDLEIILNGASGSLEAAGNGVIVKTGGTTVTARTISTSGAGLTISNGNGVSGNPTIALDGLVASLANMSGTGILGVVGGSSITSMVITGTSNQITVANGAGPGNPTLALASDPVIPGTGAMVVPKGTTAERPGGVDGMLRFNTDTDAFEIYDSGGWDTLPAGAITLINTGTGLTGGPITSSGTISIANTGVTAATYGSASAVPQVAINAQGQITSASDVSIAISASQVTSGSFDITQGAVGLTSYTAGDLVYYVSGTTLTNLAIGSSTYVMTSSGSAPQWTDPATITVGTASSATTATTATNLAAGAANQIPYQTGAGATAFVSAPTIASTVLQWSGSAFQWASVGTGSVTSVDVSGGTTGLTTSGGPITGSGTITIAGTLITSNGGTGLTTYTAGDLVYYSTGTALSKLGIGSSTYILTSSGTAPQWSDPSGVTVGSATSATTATNVANGAANQIVYNTASGTTSFITAPTVANTYLEWSGSAFQWSANPVGSVTSVDVSGGTTGLTTSGGPITTSGTITLAGTLITSNGGTGLSSYTAGDLVYYATGTALSKLGIGSSTFLLTSSGTAPQWSDPSGVTVGAATSATNATNVAVTATSTNATFYPAFVDATSGNQGVEVDTDLTYNPSTNTLTAGTMTATTGIFGGTF
jgi:trimeric autotransporter adhesin